MLLLDSAGKERVRLEGYLPNNDFVAALMSGLGRIAFVQKNYADVERWYGDKARLRPARAYEEGRGEKGPNTNNNGSEQRSLPQPTDLIFPKLQRELFKTILKEENLRFDREGRPRTASSLRHSLFKGWNIPVSNLACGCTETLEQCHKTMGVIDESAVWTNHTYQFSGSSLHVLVLDGVGGDLAQAGQRA